MNEKIRTVLFTLAITAVFVFMVSGINSLLADKISANRTIARQKVILKLFGLLPADRQVDDTAIPALFAAETSPISFPSQPQYECYRPGRSSAKLFVIAFKGQGFWDNISGFIALNLDNNTISGLEFTQHGETPGLGGRISEPEFKARLAG
jgi:Na+-transporting NADH:ubiquinone oxidoreductase subunit C